MYDRRMKRPLLIDGCEVEFVDAERVRALLPALPSRDDAAQVADLFRVLADPTRVTILSALAADALCNCDLAALLGISESAVSHQMRELRLMRLVDAERRGRMVYYRLRDEHVRHVLLDTMQHVAEDARRTNAAPVGRNKRARR